MRAAVGPLPDAAARTRLVAAIAGR
jgi:hypothetical protein